jgi:hypothetical protein
MALEGIERAAGAQFENLAHSPANFSKFSQKRKCAAGNALALNISMAIIFKMFCYRQAIRLR